jgi:predicted chitinase
MNGEYRGRMNGRMAGEENYQVCINSAVDPILENQAPLNFDMGVQVLP